MEEKEEEGQEDREEEKEEEKDEENEEVEQPPAAALEEIFSADQLAKAQLCSKQSYVQVTVGSGALKRKKLLVAISATQSPDHQKLLQSLVKTLAAKGSFTKTDALRLRKKLLGN